MGKNLEKLIQTFISFDYSKRTTDMFHRWLLRYGSTVRKEEALSKLWRKTKGISTGTDTEYSFLQVMQKIGVEPVQEKKSHSYRLVISNKWEVWKKISVAAVLVIISGIATFLGTHNYFNNDNAVMTEFYVKNGTKESISLPDGTKVYLNSGSHILYPENLQGISRTVYLSGEAVFKVAKDPERPFIVRSSNVNVVALGTEFNVKAYPEENTITASLLSGKIQVNCNDTANYILSPGHRLVYDKLTSESIVEEVNMKDVTAWVRGEIVIDNATISEILQVLERHYGIEFNISTRNNNNDRYNFVFEKNASLDETLEVMQIVIGQFNYRLKDGVCYISW